MSGNALVFGGLGALGAAISEELTAEGWRVLVAGRDDRPGVDVSLSSPDWASRVAEGGPVEGIVWAQGLNARGGVLDTDTDTMHKLYDANVVFVSKTLRALLDAGAVMKPARGVIISSIWQVAARADKLAYVASKAALSGLIPALAADLADWPFAVNGVLPGVIDTPMTRIQLSQDAIRRIESATPGGSLATPSDVARTTGWLLGPSSTGVNGQWVAVDNGWSVVRRV